MIEIDIRDKLYLEEEIFQFSTGTGRSSGFSSGLLIFQSNSVDRSPTVTWKDVQDSMLGDCGLLVNIRFVRMCSGLDRLW